MGSNTSGMDSKSLIRGMELRLETLVDGLENALPAGTTTITVGGVVMKISDVVKTAEQLEQPFKQGREAHAVLRQLAITREKDRSAAVEFLAEVRPAIVSLFGRTNVDLTKFGFKPLAPATKLTPEQKVLRAAKARLTRQARHTLGSRQKEDLRVKDAPAVAISPDGEVTIGAAPKPPAAPVAPSPAPIPRAM